jgi:Ser/Thr protein kinase RdoA (MazF antagonist)
MESARAATVTSNAADLVATWLGGCPSQIEPIRQGGFSGAAVLRVTAAEARGWALKRLGCGAAAARRARWIHSLARHTRSHGIDVVPEPQATPDGETVVIADDGGVWELVSWVPGRPAESPTPRQAAAAVQALARLHAVWSSAPAGPRMAGPAREVAPAVRRRVEQAAALTARPWSVRRQVARRDVDGPLHEAVAVRLERATDIMTAAGGVEAVARAAAIRSPSLPVQIVIRDVWAEHVLYMPDDRVAGIIDLHAAARDTPATDIARLVGSWRLPAGAAQDARAAWFAEALDAYAAIRPLSPDERAVVPWLHGMGTVLGIDNWFRWVLDERRAFADATRVAERIDRLLEELPRALASLAAIPAGSPGV